MWIRKYFNYYVKTIHLKWILNFFIKAEYYILNITKGLDLFSIYSNNRCYATES